MKKLIKNHYFSVIKMIPKELLECHSPFEYLLKESNKRWKLLRELSQGKPSLLLAEENGLRIYSGNTPMVEGRCIDVDPEGVAIYYPIREPGIV